MTPVLRDATLTDAPLLVKIGTETFTDTFGHLYHPDDLAAFIGRFTVAAWEEELSNPRYHVVLAMAGDEAVGYAKLGPPSLPFEPTGVAIELRQFYLRKEVQGTGLAATLMEHMLAKARATGADELFLSVFVDNHRARRFYERYGFERVGTYDFMVGNHRDEDDVMRVAL